MELWKDIPNFEGLYQVSNLGNVRSLDRCVYQKNCSNNIVKHIYKGKILKKIVNTKNYLVVCLCKNGMVTKKTIHRLVAKAFIPNPENKPQVNHKDSNRQNNNVSNLEWVTNSENTKHAYKHGFKKAYWTGIKGRYNPSSKKIEQYDKQGNLIKIWECMSDIQRETGLNVANICNCCKLKIKSVGVYVWKYGKD